MRDLEYEIAQAQCVIEQMSVRFRELELKLQHVTNERDLLNRELRMMQRMVDQFERQVGASMQARWIGDRTDELTYARKSHGKSDLRGKHADDDDVRSWSVDFKTLRQGGF